MERKLYGIVGFPLKHTLSPVLHNWAFEQTGLPACYFTWEVPPDNLDSFVVALTVLPIAGCSVTIPFKQRIVPYMHSLTPQAGEIGAINTIFWHNGKLVGDNSDCIGIIKSLEEAGYTRFDRVLILGGGGVAKAAIWSLKQLGVKKIVLALRHIEQAQALTKKWGVKVVAWEDRTAIQADLLINATPLGMYGQWRDSIPYPAFLLSNFEVVFDLVYNPVQTTLLEAAKQAGCVVINGLTLFVAQARAQFKVWTGQDFSLQTAFSLLESRLQVS